MERLSRVLLKEVVAKATASRGRNTRSPGVLRACVNAFPRDWSRRQGAKRAKVAGVGGGKRAVDDVLEAFGESKETIVESLRLKDETGKVSTKSAKSMRYTRVSRNDTVNTEKTVYSRALEA